MTGTPLLLAGRYELGDVLGRGGMAEVHSGYDSRLGRPVAVKVLRADLARDPNFQARFRREAQSAASLNHPSIVAVYDTGEDAIDGQPAPFIVMELVEGSSLRELISSGHRLLPERALEIADGVLGALDYSHRHGIIHRDIKPGNVMLTPAGEVKVMDFGIARAVADSAATLTQSAAIIGTAQYLSPEQARGQAVDARSDLYSTGCLLYELLTGRPPFAGDSPVSVAYQHVREEPRPPSALEPDIPPAVDAIVLRALAKDPDARYQSAAEMRADIARALSGQPVQAPQPARGAAAVPVAAAPATAVVHRDVRDEHEEAAPPERRRRGAGWLLLLPLLLLLAGGAFLLSRSLFDDSASSAQVRVPDVRRMTTEEASRTLEDAGLKMAVDAESTSDETPGTVLSQTPAADALAARGSTVRVRVASAPGQVSVPDVVGRSLAQARTALEETGLRAGRVEEQESARPAGEVLETDPAEGDSVARGSSVALLVASGSNTVPDVDGRSLDRARSELEEAGFDVRVETRRTDAEDPGTVLAQTPRGGTTSKLGSTVTLTVAAAAPQPTPPPTPTVPSPSSSPTPTRTSPTTPTTPTTPSSSPTPTPTPTPSSPTPTPTRTPSPTPTPS